MDNKQMGSEDLASPGIHGFKDWTSKPSKNMKDTPTSRLDKQNSDGLDKQNLDLLDRRNPDGLDRQNLDDPVVMAAHLCEGETVITIGACPEMGPSTMAKAVGSTGQIICVMPKTSTSEAAQAMLRCNIPNIRCMESSMTAIDARDNTADAVMSSVLSSHVPPREMQSVLEEMFRVLRPGGRMCMTDIMMRKDMPETTRNAIPAACNMLKTGLMTAMYESYLKSAGFENISIKDTRKDVNTCVTEQQGGLQSQQHEPSGAYESQQARRKDEDKGGSYRRKVGKFTRQLVAGQDEKEEDVDWNDYAGMFQIMARKPL